MCLVYKSETLDTKTHLFWKYSYSALAYSQEMAIIECLLFRLCDSSPLVSSKHPHILPSPHQIPLF